jgi:acyl-coenzyme A synthetase/AMP-(fatty) acid ligase
MTVSATGIGTATPTAVISGSVVDPEPANNSAATSIVLTQQPAVISLVESRRSGGGGFADALLLLAMASLLGSTDASPVLGGTVAPAHMFGFEMLVMQPLRGRATLYAPRIAYPSDLSAFASVSSGERWLVTTPFHLRLFIRAGAPAAGLTRVITATMPLDESLAQDFEQASGVEVGEIYGSTESGCLGYRRTAREKVFAPAPGVTVEIAESGEARFSAPYLRQPVALNDRLELDDDGFHLLGRDFDTVKVAGKRASLSALTRTLQNVSGIEDGCFFDATRNGHTRLAAFVVAPGVTREVIREALAGQLDAAFLPRPLIVVDSLPRDSNGKLQHTALERLLAEDA